MRVFKIQTMADDEAGIFFQKLMDGRMDEVMSSLLPPYFAPFLPKTPASSQQQCPFARSRSRLERVEMKSALNE